MSEESIVNITKSNSNFTPNFVDHQLVPDMNFNEHCLIFHCITFLSLKKTIDLYVLYTLDPQFKNLKTDFKLGNSIFVSVKITKNADLDKYNYSSSDVGFGFRSEFSLTYGTMGKHVIIYGADISSSMHIDNKRKIS